MPSILVGAVASSSLNPNPKKWGGGVLSINLAALVLETASNAPITITTCPSCSWILPVSKIPLGFHNSVSPSSIIPQSLKPS